MKIYWPLVLFIAIVVAFFVFYLNGWGIAAGVMVAVMIVFPGVHVGVIILCHEITEARKSSRPPE
ncbi:MAG: hypothetical protein Q4G71_12505 [Pseudomonadota bacterium]|nr:hypothetical protein [Pseudomonadota bacterium]